MIGKNNANNDWERLYAAAKSMQNSRKVSSWIEVGQVAAKQLKDLFPNWWGMKGV